MSVPRDDGSVIELMRLSQSDADRPASERVVQRVATAEGVAPDELDERLYDAVDGDALDALVADDSQVVTVSFEFCGYEVTVAGESATTVTIEPTE